MNNRINKLPLGEIIPLRFDYVFAGIFNDENNIDIVESFVSQYFNIPLIKVIGNVKIMNRELPINNKKERNKQVDLLLKYNEELINIEINNYDMSEGTIDRNIILACHTHGTQLKYGDNDYSNINRTIQINFNKKYHNENNIMDNYFFTNSNGKMLSKKIEIDMIDIDKGSKLWYSNTNDVICAWCKLLDTNKEEF